MLKINLDFDSETNYKLLIRIEYVLDINNF